MLPKRIRSIACYIVKTLAKGRETRASRSINKKIDIKETPYKDKKKTDNNVITTSTT